MSNSKYAGEFEIVLEKKNDKTVISEKRYICVPNNASISWHASIVMATS